MMLGGTHWRTIRAAVTRLQELGKVTSEHGQVMAGVLERIEEATKRVLKATENGSMGGRPLKKINGIQKPDGLSAEKLLPLPLPPPPPISPSSSTEEDGLDAPPRTICSRCTDRGRAEDQGGDREGKPLPAGQRGVRPAGWRHCHKHPRGERKQSSPGTGIRRGLRRQARPVRVGEPLAAPVRAAGFACRDRQFERWPDGAPVKTATDLLAAAGITLRTYRFGNQKCQCPQCSHKRRNKRDPVPVGEDRRGRRPIPLPQLHIRRWSFLR